MKRVLIVGGGGREHALAWACARDRDDVELICAPGNGGTAAIAENIVLDVTDAQGIARLARERDVDLVIIGPDAAAAAGVADACIAAGVPVFGPTAAAARIESSKVFAKQLMDEVGIPTARWVTGVAEDRGRLDAFVAELGGCCVVKADGLALGKGVIVCETAEDARQALEACLDERRFGDAGTRVVVEERLQGREASIFALSDGCRLRVLPPARDHKRAGDGDTGPNTGGMGAIAPPPGPDEALVQRVLECVLQPAVDALRRRGTPFSGCLYAGIMLTDEGPMVLEFNARFGDPEAQVVLPLLQEPFLELLESAARDALEPGVTTVRGAYAACVVAASAGYPGAARSGDVITGLDEVGAGVLCFHAGTKRDPEGMLRTAGGRVLSLVAVEPDLDDASRSVYANIAHVHFNGMWFRRDIGSAPRAAALSGST